MQIDQNLIADIKNIMQSARNKAYAAVNFYMVEAYWKIGERIFLEEQKGKARAGYGDRLIKELSKKLTKEYGKGFDDSNLHNFRQFYLSFRGTQKVDAVRRQIQSNDNQPGEKVGEACTFSQVANNFQLRRELTWTHYRMIMRVDNMQARKYNPTVGVILCTDKDATIVKYSVLNGNEQLFATKYKSCLPSEQELIAEIERSKLFLKEKLINTVIQ